MKYVVVCPFWVVENKSRWIPSKTESGSLWFSANFKSTTTPPDSD